ncbi:hypothetical protein Tco_1354081 [Tanacetum coccineum]
MSALRLSDNENYQVRYQDYQDKECQGRLLDGFQENIKYEHVGPKTQDRKKAKYYKDDQVTIKDLKGKVKRIGQRQRKDQDPYHKSMIGTKGTSSTITRERLNIKTRSFKDQKSKSQRDLYDHPLGGDWCSLAFHIDEWKSFQCQHQTALRYQDYQDKDCQGRLLDGFQDDIKYEHVGPKTQDRKKAKYYKDDQKGKQIGGELSTPKKSLKITIKQRQPDPSAPIPTVSDIERDQLIEATQLSLAEAKIAKEYEAQQNVALVESSILAEDFKKIVEGDDVSDDDIFGDSMILSQEDFSTWLELRSHKENM